MNGDYAIHQATREVVQVCVAMYMAVIQEDTEVESCAAAVRMLKDIVDMCGPYVLVNAEAPTTVRVRARGAARLPPARAPCQEKLGVGSRLVGPSLICSRNTARDRLRAASSTRMG